ncbi:hypothetical protein ACFYYD_10810 [Streptomyces bluensis]|uniref:hypothetical protein n=1 Tax=Streptomyces bluensis TaxID=33897 RepID=UPI00368B28A0
MDLALTRPATRLTNAELVTLAVAQAMLGFSLRSPLAALRTAHLHGLFPYLPTCPSARPTTSACGPRSPASPGATARPGLLILAGKGYIAAELDRFLATRGISLRPSHRIRGTPWPGESMLKTVRQLIEPVNDTLKGQPDLEEHGGRTIEGVGVRVAQRILAMTCAIWHNRTIDAPITRSLTAYDR